MHIKEPMPPVSRSSLARAGARFAANERGGTFVEYGLVLVALVLVVAGGFRVLGTKVDCTVTGVFGSAPSGSCGGATAAAGASSGAASGGVSGASAGGGAQSSGGSTPSGSLAAFGGGVGAGGGTAFGNVASAGSLGSGSASAGGATM